MNGILLNQVVKSNLNMYKDNNDIDTTTGLNVQGSLNVDNTQLDSNVIPSNSCFIGDNNSITQTSSGQIGSSNYIFGRGNKIKPNSDNGASYNMILGFTNTLGTGGYPCENIIVGNYNEIYGGDYVYCFGQNLSSSKTNTSVNPQILIGYYNETILNDGVYIGNGTSNNNRHTAIEIPTGRNIQINQNTNINGLLVVNDTVEINSGSTTRLVFGWPNNYSEDSSKFTSLSFTNESTPKLGIYAEGDIMNNASITDSSGAIATTAWVSQKISSIEEGEKLTKGSDVINSLLFGGNGNRMLAGVNSAILGGSSNLFSQSLNSSRNNVVDNNELRECFILGGSSNILKHLDSTNNSYYLRRSGIIGGYSNTITTRNDEFDIGHADDSVIIGGSYNTLSGSRNIILGSRNSIIRDTGDGNVILGGYNLIIPNQDKNFGAGDRGVCALGSYNKYEETILDNTAFVIGNGYFDSQIDSAVRSNAFKVTYDGSIYAASSTITQGADYAEYFEWLNKNKDNNEKYANHFVTLDEDKIRVANATDDYIVGVISSNPGVIGNFDMNDTSFEEDDWGIVGLMGQIIVADDGTCAPNGYCTVADGGIATKINTNSVIKYRVLKRIDQNHIKILFR